MSVPVGYTDQSLTAVPQSTNTSNWTIDVSDIRTIKVSNISLGASDRDIKEFFSFSGDVQYVEMQRETETTQLAYVTFKDSQGADTAILLSGATIADLSVTITPVEDYHLPPEALSSTSVDFCVSPLDADAKRAIRESKLRYAEKRPPVAGSAVKKAEDVVSTMLAKGFVLGKDAINKAKSFDERHHLSSNASATVASIDQRMGLTGKLSIGTAVVNEKMREMDERFRVSEKTNLHLLFVEQKASSAGSAIMGNRYVSAGASWVSSAFSAVVKAAEDVSMMTKEKVEKAEEEKKEILYKERTGIVRDFAHIHLDDSPAGEPPIVPVDLSDSKLGII